MDIEREKKRMATEKTVRTVTCALEARLSQLHKQYMKLRDSGDGCSNVRVVEYFRGHALGMAEGFDEAKELIIGLLAKDYDEDEGDEEDGD